MWISLWSYSLPSNYRLQNSSRIVLSPFSLTNRLVPVFCMKNQNIFKIIYLQQMNVYFPPMIGMARYRLLINDLANILIIFWTTNGCIKMNSKFEKTLRRYVYAGVQLLIQCDEVDSCCHVKPVWTVHPTLIQSCYSYEYLT